MIIIKPDWTIYIYIYIFKFKVCKLFDRDGNGEIDGNEFLVGFTLLASVMKSERKLNENRKLQKIKEIEELESNEKKLKEDAKLESVVDFNFNENDSTNAYEKIKLAAKKYVSIQFFIFFKLYIK